MSDLWQSQAWLVERTGWVLVHSVWQLTIVAVLSWLLMSVQRRSVATRRYGILLVSFVFMLSLPVLTAITLQVEGSDRASASAVGILNASTRTSQSHRSSGPLAIADNDVEASQDFENQSANVPAPFAALVMRMNIGSMVRPWLPTVVACWLAGLLIFLLRPIVGWFVVRRLRRKGTSPVPHEVAQIFGRVAAKFHLPFVVQLMQSTFITAPVVIGWMRPVVLLPIAVINGLTVPQLEAVLAHELAHVRRFDAFIAVVQALFETMFFFHPAAWWISRQLHREREFCCDDLAVSTLNDRTEYSRALLAIAELKSTHGLFVLGADGGSLLYRVQRLFGKNDPVNYCRSNYFLAPLLLLSLGAATLIGIDSHNATMAAVFSSPVVAAENNIYESEAFEKIMLLGGHVRRDETLPGHPVTDIFFEGSGEFSEKYLSLLMPFTHLTTLGFSNFNDNQITNARLSELSGLKNLTALHFYSTEITDDLIKELWGVKSLTTLSLHKTKITDAGLRNLRELTNLTTLYLHGNPITSDGLKELGKLKSLSSLDLQFDQISEADLKEISELKHLGTLSLHIARTTDTELKELSQIKNLTKLYLSTSKITDAGVKELLNLTRLTDLDLSDTQITDVGLTELRTFENLSRLDLSYTRITDVGMKEISELKNLELLNLSHTQITDDGIKEISDLKNLTFLWLFGSKLTDIGVRELTGLKNLKELYIETPFLTDAGMKELGEFSNMNRLHIIQCRGITDAGLKEIRNLKNLSTLELLGCQGITDAGVQELKEHKQLAILNVGNTQITIAGVNELKESLPDTEILR